MFPLSLCSTPLSNPISDSVYRSGTNGNQWDWCWVRPLITLTKLKHYPSHLTNTLIHCLSFTHTRTQKLEKTFFISISLLHKHIMHMYKHVESFLCRNDISVKQCRPQGILMLLSNVAVLRAKLVGLISFTFLGGPCSHLKLILNTKTWFNLSI